MLANNVCLRKCNSHWNKNMVINKRVTIQNNLTLTQNSLLNNENFNHST